MNTKRHVLASLVATALVVSLLALSGTELGAQGSGPRPLLAEDFSYSPVRGFGDRGNSWAQGMAWWQGHLYVATSRYSSCTSLYSLWQAVSLLISPAFANTFLPYPPNNAYLDCPPDGTLIPLQAEIWRWTPAADSWDRVYQSPNELVNPGPGDPYPAPPNRFLPYEIAFRGLRAFSEPDGTEALYAFSINSTVLADRSQLPPPRILRSVDGVTWTPVPQDPGTFLHDLPFNPDHSSFRSPTVFNGRMFVLSGPIFGQGSLIASADPGKGNDAWFLAADPEVTFYEMAVFNDWLYLGTLDRTGYRVLKTKAEGAPPYQFQTVVPSGAFVTPGPSGSVVSMNVFNDRLIVGTGSNTEVLQINADDTWDLLVGPPRQMPVAGGGTEWKYPRTGLGWGWGQTLNDHAWQMEEVDGYLYIGTYNAATGSVADPVNGPLLRHTMGAHLYRTRDNWYHHPITTNGFDYLGDLQGGMFDFGIRTMATTPHGTFFGTANDYYGLTVLRARPQGEVPPPEKLPVERLEIEPSRYGSAVLSWVERPGAKNYQIWRAEIRKIYVRDNSNVEGWNGASGNKIEDTYITEYVCLDAVKGTTYVDNGVLPDKQYIYYIRAEGESGGISDPSNVAMFPLVTPAMSFAELNQQLARLEARGRYADPTVMLMPLKEAVATAARQAAICKLQTSIRTLSLADTSLVPSPDRLDVDVMIAKIQRRLHLQATVPPPQTIIAPEFCIP